MGFLLEFIFFAKGIKAKLNELESECDILVKISLKSEKFLIPPPHCNFPIVNCV